MFFNKFLFRSTYNYLKKNTSTRKIITFQHHRHAFKRKYTTGSTPNYLNWWINNRIKIKSKLKTFLKIGLPIYFVFNFIMIYPEVPFQFFKNNDFLSKIVMFLMLITVSYDPFFLINLCEKGGWLSWIMDRVTLNDEILTPDVTHKNEKDIIHEFFSKIKLKRVVIENSNKLSHLELIYKDKYNKEKGIKIKRIKSERDCNLSEYEIYPNIITDSVKIKNMDSNNLKFYGYYEKEEQSKEELKMYCFNILAYITQNEMIRYRLLTGPYLDRITEGIEKENINDNKMKTNNIRNKVTIEEFLIFVYEKLILQDISNISILGTQILFGLSKDKYLNKVILETGGLKLLCRIAMAKNFQLANMAALPIASLAQNTPDLDKLELSGRERNIILRAIFTVASQLVQTGNYKHALYALNDCLKLEKENLMVLNLLAIVHLHFKNYKKSNECLKLLIKRMPDPTDIYYALALNLHQHGKTIEDKNEAIHYLTKAIHRNTSTSPENLYFLISEILFSIGRSQESIEYLSELCSTTYGSKLSKAHLTLGNILLKSKTNKEDSIKKAVICFEKAAKLQPFSSDTHRKLAECYLKSGDNKKAEEICKIALKINPDSIDTLLLYGEITKRLCKWGEMKKIYDKIMEKKKNITPIIHYQHAIANEKIGNYKESLVIFTKALNSWIRICSNEISKKQWFDNHPIDLIAIRKIGQRCNDGYGKEYNEIVSLKDAYNRLISECGKMI